MMKPKIKTGNAPETCCHEGCDPVPLADMFTPDDTIDYTAEYPRSECYKTLLQAQSKLSVAHDCLQNYIIKQDLMLHNHLGTFSKFFRHEYEYLSSVLTKRVIEVTRLIDHEGMYVCQLMAQVMNARINHLKRGVERYKLYDDYEPQLGTVSMLIAKLFNDLKQPIEMVYKSEFGPEFDLDRRSKVDRVKNVSIYIT